MIHRAAPRPRAASPRAFTIVELLVVIAIIAALVGLVLAGLSGALKSAAKTQELSDLRQLYNGWSMYSSTYDEYLIPGHLDENMQDRWRVSYRDKRGDDLLPADCVGYAWRLAPFVDFSWQVMVGYRDDATRDLADLSPEIVAAGPAFGYNANYVGGWWEDDGSAPRLRFDDIQGADYQGLVARTAGSIARPSEQVVFASSTLREPGAYKKNVSEILAGSPYVVPPFLGEDAVWSVLLGDATGMQVTTAESVPLGRGTPYVATLSADGSTTSASLQELLDMRRWVNPATTSGWTHPNE